MKRKLEKNHRNRLLFLILCAIFCLPHSKISAQTNFRSYYELMNSYLILKADSNPKAAYSNLELALNEYDGYANWYDDLIDYKLSLGDRQAALKYARKATLLGYQYYNDNIWDSTESNVFFVDTLFVKELKRNYPTWRKECIGKRSDYEITLNTELQKMASDEQFIRCYIHLSKKQETWVYTNIADSINFFLLKSLILKNGFPMRQSLDFKSYKSLSLMLIHMRTLSCVSAISEVEMSWLDSTMKANVYAGNLHPTDYAFAVDRYTEFYHSHVLKKPEMQVYGECNSSDVFTNFIDPKNIDKRRSEIFLIPLKYKSRYAKLALPNSFK